MVSKELILKFSPQELNVLLGFINNAINKGGLALGDVMNIASPVFRIQEELNKARKEQEEQDQKLTEMVAAGKAAEEEKKN